MRFSLYNSLRALPFGVTVLLTVLLYAGVLALLVFLLCAAGHKAGREGISLNFHMDRHSRRHQRTVRQHTVLRHHLPFFSRVARVSRVARATATP